MLNNTTIDKLIEMHLTAMADAFRIQMNDASMKEVAFEDRFGMLVDVEYTSRKNNRLKRLIHAEYSCAVKPHVRSDGNRQSGTRKPLSASLLA